MNDDRQQDVLRQSPTATRAYAVVALSLASALLTAGPARAAGPRVLHLSLGAERQVVASQEPAAELGAVPLLVGQDTTVRFSKGSYVLDKEGLYRFLLPYTHVQHVIFYRGESVIELLSAIAQIHIHGNRDNGLVYEDAKARMRTGRIVLTGFYVSRLASQLCEEVNVGSREVGAIALAPWDGQSDSHNMLEVRDPGTGQWMLVDLDNKCMFRKDGAFLSLHETCSAFVGTQAVEMVRLTRTPALDIKWQEDGVNRSIFEEDRFLNQAVLRQWYQRVLQVPVMLADKAYCLADGHEQRVKEFSDRLVPKARSPWLTTFYPGGE